jgi:uncharacterized protein YxjI
VNVTYPLTATFRILALSPEIQVKNAQGEMLLQVKQKLMTLREATTVFADEAKTQPLYQMKADRIMGFGATHHITRAADGAAVGAVRADGLRSIWRARYTVMSAQGGEVFHIREENPWIKVLHEMAEEIPFLGVFIGMYINPRYLLADPSGTVRYRITKRRSFVSRNFTLEELTPDADAGLDERLVALSLIQVMMLERSRG